MNDQTGMPMAYLSPRLYQLALTVADAKWVRSFSTPTGELLVVGTMAPSLAVLAAWLGSALGLPLVLILAVAMTLALALVLPFMLRATLSSTPTVTVDTRFIAPTSPAEDASSSFAALDYEGWSGQMANTIGDVPLTVDQIEFLIDLLDNYQEKTDDLTQNEWAEIQSLKDTLDMVLNGG